MIDSIGLGEALFYFGLLCGGVFFAIGFSALKFIFKKNLSWSLLGGIIFGVIGFIASPNIFYYLLKFNGYGL